MTTTTASASPRRVSLTPRDDAILASVATARCLTAVAIEWLAFPDRRPDWTAGRDHPPYKVGQVVHRRLRYLVEAGYLHRIVRPIARSGRGGGRDPDVFFLSDAGADALLEVSDVDAATITAVRERPRSSFTTDHSVEIGLVYAALRTKIAAMPGVQMTDWRGDHQTAKAYDRLEVSQRSGGVVRRVTLPVVPDGTFVLHHPGGSARIFIEVDRGSRRIDTWRDKIQAYHAYMGSAALKARYGVDTFILLAIAPTTTQQRRLMDATASVLGAASSRYLFCLSTAVHPLTIGTAWLKIGGITTTRMPAGMRGQRPEVTTAEPVAHVLLQ